MGPWTHLESVVSTEAVEAMLARDRAEWQALVRVLEARPGHSLHDPESPTWNSRDVYAHLARWMEQSTAHLEAALVCSSFAPVEGTDDEINARWQSEAQRLSLEETRSWAMRVFERRIEVIESVKPTQWNDRTFAIANADGAEHYAAHHRYIVV